MESWLWTLLVPPKQNEPHRLFRSEEGRKFLLFCRIPQVTPNDDPEFVLNMRCGRIY